MKVTIEKPEGGSWKADLSKPVDISISYKDQGPLRAWYLGPVKIDPVQSGKWIGDVKKGGTVNFKTITLNPHAHGTHTETVGHISEEEFPLNKEVISCHTLAVVISVEPATIDEDKVITEEIIKNALKDYDSSVMTTALVVRTIPNSTGKLEKDYSNTNPPYFSAGAIEEILDFGIEHLLTDLPSVDRESDEGKLVAHKKFWGFPNKIKSNRTITEFVFVPDAVIDGLYLLELQTINLENDAVPSRPVLFRLIENN